VTPRARRRFYVGFAAVVVALFLGGMFAAYLSRHDTICSDRKPPVAQQDLGLGQISYRCHNGQIVNK